MVFVTIKLDTGGYWGLMFVIAVPGVLAAQKNGYHVRVVLGLLRKGKGARSFSLVDFSKTAGTFSFSLESSCNYGGVRNGMTM